MPLQTDQFCVNNQDQTFQDMAMQIKVSATVGNRGAKCGFANEHTW